jgi:TRAP-type C4-dicarboxylate transport system substrate-binding protein
MPEVTWELINEYPATVLAGEADAFFAAAVARRTDGRVAIRPIPDGRSGLRTREQLGAVADGRFAMASSFAGALAKESSIFLLSSLPFVTQSAEDARALADAAMPLYERLFAERQQKPIYVSPWPPSGLWSARAVDSVAALRSLKVRTYDSASAEVFARAAQAARAVSFADLPPMLASGEIDAVLSSGDGDAGRRLQAHLKHFTAINYAVPLSFGTVSLDAWDRLNPGDQAAIAAAGRETTAHQWAAMAGRVARNHTEFRTNGVQVVERPTADVMATLRAAAVQTLAHWRRIAGDEAASILDAQLRR